jgi:hypothetical protein
MLVPLPFILINQFGIAPFLGEAKCFCCRPEPIKGLDRVFEITEIKKGK